MTRSTRPSSRGRRHEPADLFDGAISETVFHDVPVRGKESVPRSALRYWSGIDLEPTRDLRLVDLTSVGLSRLGVARTELIETGPRTYPQTGEWAQGLHACRERPDGLVWVSRQHDRRSPSFSSATASNARNCS